MAFMAFVGMRTQSNCDSSYRGGISYECVVLEACAKNVGTLVGSKTLGHHCVFGLAQ